MLSGSVRILNLDQSLTRQQKLCAKFNPAIVDLTDFSSAARHWLTTTTARRINSLLNPRDRNAVTFIGSGDYHHLCSLLIEKFQQPLSLVVFDYHPDWDVMPPRLGCGSWVSNVLKRDNIKKAILVGVSSEDISTFRIQTANLASLKSNRLEIYPWQHGPTAVIARRVPDNVSLEVTRGLFLNKIRWRQLKQENLKGFFTQVLKRIPTKEVYVSIDKDCLRNEESLTNWEEGCFSLEDLMMMLGLIKERFDIVGLDLSGDYSRPRVRNIFKRISLAWDHPRNYSASGKEESLIDATNEQTNIRILELLQA
jgi:arginase family enzyme